MRLGLPARAAAAPRSARLRALFAIACVALAGCAAIDKTSRAPGERPLTAAEGRARVARLLPESLGDRNGWATDIYAAFATLDIAPTAENICAVVAVTEQESGFRADPSVPGLPAIAWREIEQRRERAGVPRLLLDAALALPTANGKSYRERLDTVKTERQLSDLFEEFIDMVPFGRRFFADRNPVRTGGPMQVSIAYARAQAAAKPYPYPVETNLRQEVFTRRGGMHFGIAHLLDYPAAYDRPLYRFADFNAGHYASRNAAFQSAVTQVSGVPLDQDGDLLRYVDGEPAPEPGATELATRTLAARLALTNADIRRDLQTGKTRDFERTRLYVRTFALADARSASAVPRAVVPGIPLRSPKITRELTTNWFAQRVEARYQSCLKRRRET